jgi:BirA family biotin operon repressor/biotin-[acetyl-CoA-carboxylase] ligase
VEEIALADWSGRGPQFWQREWQSGPVRLYQEVASTNDVTARLAAEGSPHLTVVLAECQTSGRGRGGSTWHAPAGEALLFSVLFRVPRPGAAPGCAPIRIGMAIAEAIAAVCGIKARIKWPNDIVIPGQGKVAGILCEGSVGLEGGYIVAGVGINVSQHAEAFGPELGQACSIASATGQWVDRDVLMTEIMTRLRAIASRMTEPLNQSEAARIAALDILSGQEISCDTGESVLEGRAAGIAEDGALIIDVHSAPQRVYNASVRLAESQAYPGTRNQS